MSSGLEELYEEDLALTYSAFPLKGYNQRPGESEG
jgi:hypothetical protein